MTKAFASLALVFSGAVDGQSTPRFEVASIKPSVTDRSHSTGLQTGNGLLRVGNETLKRCIMGAYAIGPNQIIGGPEWLDSDRYDITAKAEQPVGDKALMGMLQTLMAERFKLAVHRETRTIRALVLEVAKGGPKLEKSSGGQATTQNGRGLIDAKAITMRRFAEVLSRQMYLPVVDETGLGGVYNLKVQWILESAKPTNADAGPSVFTALQEQLGLRLISRKAPVEVVVIDHAERPSEN